LRNAEASAYLCGPYRRHLPLMEKIDDLQQLKAARIVYRQVKFRDSVLRIQVEDRSQLATQMNGNDQIGGMSEKIGGGQRMTQQVPEVHWDGITDLLSIYPDLLISSGREGVIKLWKIC
jgi:hypothetical protein